MLSSNLDQKQESAHVRKPSSLITRLTSQKLMPCLLHILTRRSGKGVVHDICWEPTVLPFQALSIWYFRQVSKRPTETIDSQMD